MSETIGELSKTKSLIVTPDGEMAEKPTLILDSKEADLLRRYKKLLLKYGLREALYCNTCFEGNLADGMRAFVTDSQILLDCRCTTRFYQGQSF